MMFAKLSIAVSALTIAAVSSASAETVTLTAYSGIFQDHYTKAVIEPFMKKYPDITVQFYGMPNSAQMLGTLRAQKSSPQIDVAILDVSVAKAGTDEGLFDKVDESVSANVKDLYPKRACRGCGRGRRYLRQSGPNLQYGSGEGRAEVLERALGQAV